MVCKLIAFWGKLFRNVWQPFQMNFDIYIVNANCWDIVILPIVILYYSCVLVACLYRLWLPRSLLCYWCDMYLVALVVDLFLSGYSAQQKLTATRWTNRIYKQLSTKTTPFRVLGVFCFIPALRIFRYLALSIIWFNLLSLSPSYDFLEF